MKNNIYQIFYKKRQAKEKAKLEKQRQEILKQLPEISRVLKELRAKRVLVYGSVLRSKSFHHRSDLDILVYGLDDSLWYKAFKVVENLPNIEIDVDVKMAQDMREEFLCFVEKYGRFI
ncbi:Polymerase beta nucleotidyltransferase domain-containing protein [Candidatus Magnetomoraceae bacterium gMMP-15]